MATEIKLPHLGENLEGGEVVAIKVAAGDQVKEGQPLLEVEAEKSTLEVPAPAAGRVAKVLVKKGDKVKTNQLLFLLEDGAADKESAPKPTAAATAAPSQPAPPPTPAPQAQQPAAPPAAPPTSASVPAPVKPDGAPSTQLVPAGPATRHLAREMGIDLGKVRGSGRYGRVTQEDVKAYVKQIVTSQPAPAAGAPGISVPPMPDFEKWGPVERKPMEGIRRVTANQMSLAWSVIPHVTQNDLADITELEAFRKEQDVKAKEGKGPRLTVTAFALKASAIALKQMPNFNASLDMTGGQLIFKKYYHIGVAVDTDRGLLVPVIRDVDKKTVVELAKELTEIAERARAKKITKEDMSGGTFTITNLGGIGGTGFTPIVNYPEVAILGLSRGRLQPVFKDGQFVPRLLLPLSLSYDHRMIDGADAARFTRRIAEMLENPMVMLLHA
jgi:pyruvate dehydrogenase E2 component (dihydrolipoamide acetyltransferase)